MISLSSPRRFSGEWDKRTPPIDGLRVEMTSIGGIEPGDDGSFSDFTRNPQEVSRMRVPAKYWAAMVLLDWYISCAQFTHDQATRDANKPSASARDRDVASEVANYALEHAYYHMRWRTKIIEEADEMMKATRDITTVTIPSLHKWLWQTAFNKHEEGCTREEAHDINYMSFYSLVKTLEPQWEKAIPSALLWPDADGWPGLSAGWNESILGDNPWWNGPPQLPQGPRATKPDFKPVLKFLRTTYTGLRKRVVVAAKKSCPEEDGMGKGKGRRKTTEKSKEQVRARVDKRKVKASEAKPAPSTPSLNLDTADSSIMSDHAIENARDAPSQSDTTNVNPQQPSPLLVTKDLISEGHRDQFALDLDEGLAALEPDGQSTRITQTSVSRVSQKRPRTSSTSPSVKSHTKKIRTEMGAQVATHAGGDSARQLSVVISNSRPDKALVRDTSLASASGSGAALVNEPAVRHIDFTTMKSASAQIDKSYMKDHSDSSQSPSPFDKRKAHHRIGLTRLWDNDSDPKSDDLSYFQTEPISLQWSSLGEHDNQSGISSKDVSPLHGLDGSTSQNSKVVALEQWVNGLPKAAFRDTPTPKLERMARFHPPPLESLSSRELFSPRGETAFGDSEHVPIGTEARKISEEWSLESASNDYNDEPSLAPKPFETPFAAINRDYEVPVVRSLPRSGASINDRNSPELAPSFMDDQAVIMGESLGALAHVILHQRDVSEVDEALRGWHDCLTSLPKLLLETAVLAVADPLIRAVLEKSLEYLMAAKDASSAHSRQLSTEGMACLEMLRELIACALKNT
ncbi:hypothetical protein HWV62_17844 [Athelia sp. TMB]|nr:hypothetical protein HWV62_17844 [Athelia sp. TMB]